MESLNKEYEYHPTISFLWEMDPCAMTDGGLCRWMGHIFTTGLTKMGLCFQAFLIEF